MLSLVCMMSPLPLAFCSGLRPPDAWLPCSENEAEGRRAASRGSRGGPDTLRSGGCGASPGAQQGMKQRQEAKLMHAAGFRQLQRLRYCRT